MMGLVLGPALTVITIMGILLYATISPLYNVLWECIVVVYTLGCLKRHGKEMLGLCCCIQTCNSIVNMLVM